MKKLLTLGSFLFLVCWQGALAATTHFITDDSFRNEVGRTFEKKMTLVGKKFYDVKSLHPSSEETEALKFLYAYMPLADVTDYSTAFYLDNVRASLAARREMVWGSKVPELLFRHFVLPLRVNNENLDSARMVFYRALKDRVRGLSMTDAVLEVNHWCHEHVTYQPADARTSAPLATMRTALGRCGEESTFLVAALRSVGIPARQVYTPRWAHTDDNHAWVEAWADGKWHFLGACEPEPVLDLAWFNAPVSRAMLTHTKAFGDYRGPEEVLLRTSNYTEINLIDNYAKSARIDFHIVSADGKPVPGARVDFKIYNYAEYCPVVTKYADAQGTTSLTAGLGDMIVWASSGGKYGFAKVSFGKNKVVDIRLDHSATAQSKTENLAFDIVPPPEKAVMPEVTAEQISENKSRLAHEDSIRNAYVSTFYNKETAAKALADHGLPELLAPCLVKARGNHAVILDFLVRHRDNLKRAVSLLATLTDKDFRDMPTAILEDSYLADGDQLSPRVEDEMIIRPYKQYFSKVFSRKQVEAFRADPSLLVAWTRKNIRLNPDTQALEIAQTPVGVWKSRLTDRRSRKILFVSLARSLNIEAREDYVTKKVQYRHNGVWTDVDFDGVARAQVGKGVVKLLYQDKGAVDDPKYYYHFTLTRINSDGTTTLLEYPEDGTTWRKNFSRGVSMDPGVYLLTTGTRLANGSVLASSRLFQVSPDDTVMVDLTMRTSQTDVCVIGTFNSESTFRPVNGAAKTILSQTGRGYFVVGLIGVGQEPTNHTLRDIAKVAEAFEKWNRPVLLLFESEADAKKFHKEDFAGLPSTVVYGIDTDGAIRQQIAANMKLVNARQLPIFFIADTFNRVVFLSQGYTIGLGEQMEKVLRQL